MLSKYRFIYRQLAQQLWIRPLVFCLLAVTAAFAAAAADRIGLHDFFPEIQNDTVEKLLSIIAASMLGVATFAVGSMVSAYASVSNSATPRAFMLVISDDKSKTALSTFLAAFIFSVVSLIAIKTGLYGRAGVFVIFAMTILVLGWVVLMFVRWVDQIARLGRLGTTIDRVERAAIAAIEQRRRSPHLGGVAGERECRLRRADICRRSRLHPTHQRRGSSDLRQKLQRHSNGCSTSRDIYRARKSHRFREDGSW